MKPTLHTTTRVLPGNRIELTAPELQEGQAVEVIVIPLPRPAGETAAPGILDFLDSLPNRNRSEEYWEQRERDFQAERDSWDR